jgi:hypothetical protein
MIPIYDMPPGLNYDDRRPALIYHPRKGEISGMRPALGEYEM